ncbi:peptidase S8 and S53, subtilisin, kexin, sedolisin [Dehalococcoides mccartyi]|uniref:Peptidase S8 and S53, subtilisin, kexin, sedolisin n=1 Tax=Dehalococcoides mccartyi TaxID=61435 RepID=A0A328EQ15_9CHLR|nr:peptidase S8 and S53, subtilisin, kexin, sedolisin [Dehalococcoides mccartyi]
MRYSVISKGFPLDRIETEVKKVGGREINKTLLLGQIFCEMDEEQAKTLSRIPGLVVKLMKEYKTNQVATELPAVENISDVFYLLRSYFAIPLTGVGLTVAVLDSGIRKSHQSLGAKVIYEENFSGSPTAGDVFGHGTQVAFIIAGGMHAPGEKAGISPGASLMNIKVINDTGVGSDEGIILGIDKVCHLAEEARRQGLVPTDEMYPNVINLSLGGEDDGDPDNPVRIACRQASQVYGLDVVAAAGNFGPKMTTITLPACDPEVIAVGAVETSGELVAWDKSSRGPTLQGETKPDFVIWGTNLEMASDKEDDEYVTKSGTSFAAPMLSGLTGLLWESGRRAYGEGWLFRWTQAREVGQYFSTKPQDAPLNKDNTYGYGLPAMGTMLGQMGSVNQSSQGGMEMFPMVMMMAMMSGLMGGF